MVNIFLGIGSNLGDKKKNLNNAIDSIVKLPDIKAIKKSSFYKTKPWGELNQPFFLNCVVQLTFNKQIDLNILLKLLQKIEITMGRKRNIVWGSRLIDIDILSAGDQIINSKELTVPHPHLQKRKFVLVPFCEIAPFEEIVTLNKSVKQLLNDCTDSLGVKKYQTDK